MRTSGSADMQLARAPSVTPGSGKRHTGPRDDLELRRCCQHLGVHSGRGAHQQRVGLGHGGQQLLAVGTVNPADLYLVTECSHGRFRQFVGN